MPRKEEHERLLSAGVSRRRLRFRETGDDALLLAPQKGKFSLRRGRQKRDTNTRIICRRCSRQEW